MPVQKRIAQFGLAKQTAKGAAAANATYQFGLQGGQVVSADIDEDDLNSTWGSRIGEGHDRLLVRPGASFEAIALPSMLGLLLLGATGSVTTAGAGAPYTHTFKTGADVPYLSLFARQDAHYYKVPDAKLDELELSWDRTGGLKVRSSFQGLALDFLSAAYTATNDDRISGGLLKGIGGTFQVEGAGATIRSGSIRIANNLEAVAGSDSITPKDVFTGIQTVSVSLTIIPDDLNLFRSVVTGSAAGSTIQATPKYGTATIKHVRDANTDLTFTANRLKFMVAFPEVDPGGGPQEVVLEGALSAPAAGDAYTFALRNSVASY